MASPLTFARSDRSNSTSISAGFSTTGKSSSVGGPNNKDDVSTSCTGRCVYASVCFSRLFLSLSVPLSQSTGCVYMIGEADPSHLRNSALVA